MWSVSVPNQMPNDCAAALAVNSATRVGIVDAAEGVTDDQNATELWSVLTLIALDGNRVLMIVCRLDSLPGGGAMFDCAVSLATKSTASAGMPAARPSRAAIRWRFM